jgi:hypothetical protein
MVEITPDCLLKWCPGLPLRHSVDAPERTLFLRDKGRQDFDRYFTFNASRNDADPVSIPYQDVGTWVAMAYSFGKTTGSFFIGSCAHPPEKPPAPKMSGNRDVSHEFSVPVLTVQPSASLHA